jgi:hypothetical protein
MQTTFSIYMSPIAAAPAAPIGACRPWGTNPVRLGNRGALAGRLAG